MATSVATATKSGPFSGGPWRNTSWMIALPWTTREGGKQAPPHVQLTLQSHLWAVHCPPSLAALRREFSHWYSQSNRRQTFLGAHADYFSESHRSTEVHGPQVGNQWFTVFKFFLKDSHMLFLGKIHFRFPFLDMLVPILNTVLLMRQKDVPQLHHTGLFL